MTAFGIDLGTTNSCIAYVDDAGRPVVLRNANLEYTTPSVVYFERKESVVIGSAAKNAALLAPDRVVQLIKRQIGRQDVEYAFDGTTYTPESISALILKDLANAAERQLGTPVREVVITVPAYFGVAEQQATRQAGEIAGFKVLDVLSEPVAAAISRQEQHPASGVRHLLVYDLGGGTFDTTVIKVDGKDVVTVCTDGDRRLGGADWDEKIRRFLLDAFAEQHPRLDPTADEGFMQDLWIKAEQVKEELSNALTRRKNLRFAGQTARVELSRSRLEELTADLLDRTMKITEETVEKAGREGVAEIDEIVLVGGMTRMPVVAERLERLLGRTPRQHEPDLAVARGAAMFAMIRQTQQDESEHVADRLGITKAQAEDMRSRRVTTVIPRGFGVKVLDHNDPLAATQPLRARSYVIHLLPAGTPLPADTGPVVATTAMDNQPGIELEVWEQNGREISAELADNTLVGRGMLLGLPPRLPKGTPIHVTFAMAATGLLCVHATEPVSGREVRFELQIGGLDEAAVDQARTAVARHDISS
ncbi:Hsp70 family protein [Nonomuraea sp. PA05]|uniref:Hsp70 family protein n=1 Tax=Nonomuraea sp. PA05 TaxID=2604466 RepID=UPI0011D89BA2|nr:Hsp70 family protein [Nonomuraea sp. PA05]TYB66615.1 Hsp70 family protein [Nonomuraea sp. PA05]